MKYLVLIAVLLLVYAVWRSQRSVGRDKPPERPTSAPALPQDMVRCPVCALHLPRAEALTGREGQLYCSQEHRRLAGDVP